MNTISSQPILYLFAGLPGSGKTTLAQRLAQHTGAIFLRIDTIEQALRDLCGVDVQGEGYRLAYRIAADNLRIGLSVIADCCNPIELTRDEWEDVARLNDARWIHVDIVCSDLDEHRRRVETRLQTYSDQLMPTWEDVCSREVHPWTRPRLIIDTAHATIEESFQTLLKQTSIP